MWVSILAYFGDLRVYAQTDCAGFTVTINKTDVQCNGTLGSIDAVVTGTGAPYTFTWSNNEYNVNYSHDLINNLVAGVYTLNVTNSSGCTETLSITINPASGCGGTTTNCGSFAVNAGADQTLACGSSGTTLTASVIAAPTCSAQCALQPVEMIRYDMNNCYAYAAAGEHAVYSEFTSTYPNSPGCTSVTGSTLSTGGTTHSCTTDNGGQVGDALCIPASTSCSWSDNSANALRFNVTMDPFTAGAITGISFLHLAPQTYIFSNTGAQGSSGVNNYPTKYGIRVIKNGVEIYQSDNLTTPQSWSTANFDFTNDPDFYTTSYTTYTFEILAYCPVGNSSTVYAYDIDDIRIYGDCCIQQSSSAVSYVWSTGATTQSINVNPSINSTYTVTATGCDGCTVTDQVIVNVGSCCSSLNASTSITQPTCASPFGSATATGSGGTAPYTYAWSNGVSGATASNLAAGTYTVTITDSSSPACTTTKLVTLVQAVGCGGTSTCNMLVNAGSDQTLPCGGSGVTLTASISNPPSCATNCTLQPVNLVTYDMNNCVAASNYGLNYDFSEFTAVYPTNGGCSSVNATTLATSYNQHSCTTDAFGVAGNAMCVPASTSCSWNDNDAYALKFNVTVNPVNAGGITSLSFLHNAPVNAVLSNFNTTPQSTLNNYPTRYGIRVLKNGVEIYQSDNLPTPQSWTTANFDFTNDPDFYTTSSAVYTFEILSYCPINNGSSVYAYDLDDIKVFGDCCTSTTNSNVSYMWSTGATSQSITVNPTVNTNYTVTATGCDGCVATDQVAVTVGSCCNNLTATTALVQPTCSNTIGSATVSVSGGVAPYTYTWSNGASGATLSAAAGNYTVTITDSSSPSCSTTKNVTLNAPTGCCSAPPTTACIGDIFNLSTGGNYPNIHWYFNGVPIAGATSNTYVLTINNNNIGTYTVTSNNLPCTTNSCCPAVFTPGDCCQAPVCSTMLLSTSINSPLTFSINNYVTDADGATDINCNSFLITNVSPASAGTFTKTGCNVTFTPASNFTGTVTFQYSVADNCDASTCQSVGQVTINAPNCSLNVTALSENVSCYGDSDGSVTAVVAGAGTGLAINWVNAAGTSVGSTATVNNLPAGSYAVTVSSDGGLCVDVASVIITQPATLVASATSTPLSCNSTSTGSVSATATGGTAPYTYNWSNTPATSDPSSMTGLTAGSYTVTITDANGCTATATTAIQSSSSISLTLSPNSIGYCEDNPGTLLTVSASPSGSYTYQWLLNGGVISSSTASTYMAMFPGVYSVQVTDSQGCIAVSNAAVVSEGQTPNPFVVITGGETVVCEGQNVLLQAMGSEAGSTFEWFMGVYPNGTSVGTGPTYGVTEAGVYYVVESTTDGCEGPSAPSQFTFQPCQLDLELTKTQNVTSPVYVGSQVTYTITVINKGPDDGTGVQVYDMLPSNLSFVSSSGAYSPSTGIWNIGYLGSGQTRTLTITATVTGGGTTLNQAQVFAVEQPDIDSTPGNLSGTPDEDDEDDVVFEAIELGTIGDFVWHDVNGNGLYDAGEQPLGGVTVTLTGPGGLSLTTTTDPNGNYLFEDLIPGNYVVTVGTGPMGKILTTPGTYNVVLEAGEDDLVNDFGFGPQPIDLELVKTTTATSPIYVGSTIPYTLTLINKGPGIATGVQVTDQLPGTLQYMSSSATLGSYSAGTGIWNVGTLNVNQTVTLTINATVLSAAGSITNFAQVSDADQEDEDSTPNNNDGTPTEDDEDDVTISPSELGTIGDFVWHDLDGDGVFDTGEPALANVTVTLTYPNGTTETTLTDGTGHYLFTDLPAGSYVVTVGPGPGDKTLTTPGSYTVDLSAGEDDLLNDFGFAPQPIDLELSKTSNAPNPIYVGSEFDYTITLINKGPGIATGVVVTDQLPGELQYITHTQTGGSYTAGTGLWNVGTLGVNQTITLTITVQVNEADGDIINFAQVTAADQTDVDSTPNNSDGTPSEDDEDDVLVSPADLGTIGDQVWHDLDGDGIFDSGEPVLANILVTLTHPDGSTETTTTDSNGHYLFTDLPAGDYIVTVGPGPGDKELTTPGIYNVNLTAGEDDLVNDFGFAPMPIDLELSKTSNAPNPIYVGSEFDYTITLVNKGPGIATGVVVTDQLPGELQYITHTQTSGSYTAGTGLWNVGTLGVNQTITLTITVQVSEADGNIINFAQVTDADQTDVDSTPNNSDGTPSEDDEDDTLVSPADLGTIGDLVWHDLDGDGLFDSGEPVLANILVTLTHPDGTTETAITDGTGHYLFDNLPAGNYVVTVGPGPMSLS